MKSAWSASGSPASKLIWRLSFSTAFSRYERVICPVLYMVETRSSQ
jgi:hypothetical protein